jgi:hypothetical protein
MANNFCTHQIYRLLLDQYFAHETGLRYCFIAPGECETGSGGPVQVLAWLHMLERFLFNLLLLL